MSEPVTVAEPTPRPAELLPVPTPLAQFKQAHRQRATGEADFTKVALPTGANEQESKAELDEIANDFLLGNGPSYGKVKTLAKMLSTQDYQKIFDRLKQRIDADTDKTQGKKDWKKFIDSKTHMVAYDVANITPEKIDEGPYSPDFKKGIKHLPGNIARFALTAPRIIASNIAHAITHPKYLLDAVKKAIKNYDIREWAGRSMSWKLGAVTGIVENAYITWMAPLPGSAHIKAAVNFGLINGGILGVNYLDRRKEAGVGKDLGKGAISRGEYEEKVFAIRNRYKKAEGFLRDFGQGLAVGSGVSALDATLGKSLTGFSITEFGAHLVQPPLFKPELIRHAASPLESRLGLSSQLEGPADIVGRAGETVKEKLAQLDQVTANPREHLRLLAQQGLKDASVGISQSSQQLKEAAEKALQEGREITQQQIDALASSEIGAATTRTLGGIKQAAEDAFNNAAKGLTGDQKPKVLDDGWPPNRNPLVKPLGVAPVDDEQFKVVTLEYKAPTPTMYPPQGDGALGRIVDVSSTASAVVPDVSPVLSTLTVETTSSVGKVTSAITEALKDEPQVTDAVHAASEQRYQAVAQSLAKKLSEEGVSGQEAQMVTEQIRSELQQTAEAAYTKSLHDSLAALSASSDPKDQAIFAMLSKKSPVELKTMIKDLTDIARINNDPKTNFIERVSLLGRLGKLGLDQDSAQRIGGLVGKTQTAFDTVYAQAQTNDAIFDRAKALSQKTVAGVQITSPAAPAASGSTFYTTIPQGDTYAREGLGRTAVATTAPLETAKLETAQRLSRIVEKAGTAVVTQPEVQEFLDKSVDKQLTAARNILQKSGIALDTVSPEQASEYLSQARKTIRSVAGESFNRAIDESLAEAGRSATNQEVVQELQRLSTQSPRELGTLVSKAIADPNSAEAQKYGLFAANVQSHFEQLYREALADATLRSNLSQAANEAITAGRTLVDRYVQYPNVIEQGIEGMPVIPPIDQAFVARVLENAESEGLAVSAPAARIVQTLAQDPDVQQEVALFMQRSAGESIDVYGQLVRDVLLQQGITVPERALTPEGIQAITQYLGEQLAVYQDTSLDSALQNLAAVDQATFNRIRALKPDELLAQIENAVQTQDITTDVGRLVYNTHEVYQGLLRHPEIRNRIATELHNDLNWLSYFNREFVAPQEAVPLATAEVVTAPEIASQPVPAAAQATVPVATPAVAPEVQVSPPLPFDEVARRHSRIAQKAVAAALSQPEIQNFLNTSVGQHIDVANSLAVKIANDAGALAVTPEQASAYLSQARTVVQGMAGESFNRALDETLAQANQTAASPALIQELQALRQSSPEAFTQRVSEIVQKASTDPASSEAAFSRNLQSHFQRLYQEAEKDPVLRANLAQIGNNTLDTLDAAVDRYIRYPNAIEQGAEVLPTVDPAFVTAVMRDVQGAGIDLESPTRRILEIMSQDPDVQQEFQEFLGRKTGENIDLYGQMAREALRQQGIDLPERALTPQGLAAITSYLKDQTTVYQDASLNKALSDLQAVDQATFDNIRAIPQDELLRQLHEAMTNPTQATDVGRLANATHEVYQGLLRHPEIRNQLAEALHNDLAWLRYYNNAYLAPQEALHASVQQAVESGVESPVNQPIIANAPTSPPVTASVPPTTTVQQTIPSPEATQVNVEQTLRQRLEELLPRGGKSELLFSEVAIPSGKTVSDILVDKSYNVNWDTSDARVFGAHILVNYDALTSYWDTLAKSGIMGVSGPYPAQLNDLPKLVLDAENGDDEARKRLVEALHWVRAEQKFRVLNKESLTVLEDALGLPKKLAVGV